MKNAVILCAVMIVFVAIPVVYSTVKGYTTWFWRDPHAQVFVNGQRVPGYVHQSKHAIIVTRGDLAKPRSYWVTETPHYCGSWAAPDSFVFALGDENMPCLGLMGIEATSETATAPDRCVPVRIQGSTLEFQTIDFKRIKIIWQ